MSLGWAALLVSLAAGIRHFGAWENYYLEFRAQGNALWRWRVATDADSQKRALEAFNWARQKIQGYQDSYRKWNFLQSTGLVKTLIANVVATVSGMPEANADMVRRVVRGMGPDKSTVDPANGARVVANIAAVHVPSFCDNRYLNSYDLQAIATPEKDAHIGSGMPSAIPVRQVVDDILSAVTTSATKSLLSASFNATLKPLLAAILCHALRQNEARLLADQAHALMRAGQLEQAAAVADEAVAVASRRGRSCRPARANPVRSQQNASTSRALSRRQRPTDARFRALQPRLKTSNERSRAPGASQLFPLASIAPMDCQRRDPKQASGGARRRSTPRAASFRYGGRHHLVIVGGLGRNQQKR